MYKIINVSGISLILGWHSIPPKESITIEEWDYQANRESFKNAEKRNLINVFYEAPVNTNITGEESTPEPKTKRTRKSKKEIN